MTVCGLSDYFGGPSDERTVWDMLMSETCYPFGSQRQVVYQLRSTIRARRNNVSRCDVCGQNRRFHTTPECVVKL